MKQIRNPINEAQMKMIDLKSKGNYGLEAQIKLNLPE